MTLIRTILLFCLVFAGSAPAMAEENAAHVSVPKSLSREFAVIRNGSKIGTHKFAFAPDGEKLTVEVKALIEYKLLFIRLYLHDHRSREVWHGKRLHSMTSFTDDNGEKITLKVTAKDGELAVRSDIDGEVKTNTAPGDTPPASFWSQAALDGKQFLSTIRGGLDAIQSAFVGEETITVKGAPIKAKHYRMTGGIERDLWFDPADNMALVYLRWEAKDGSTVEYVLE